MVADQDTVSRDPSGATLNRIIPAEAPWSHVVRAGETLRLVDTEGNQAVDFLLYAAGDPGERYSAQDTVRVGRSPYLGLGSRLISSEGRVMATITADTCGQHDTSAGCCSCESNAVRFGEGTKYLHACRENFILELARHGLTKRDIVANVNFFMNVPIAPSGEFTVVEGVSAPGGYVDLRAEMDVLCVVSNCPQINNPCNGFDPTPIQALIWPATAVTPMPLAPWSPASSASAGGAAEEGQEFVAQEVGLFLGDPVPAILDHPAAHVLGDSLERL